MPVPAQPMPPQGASPQGAPAPAPAAAPKAQAPQGGAAQIVQTMMQGYQTLGDLQKKAGVDPDAMQMLEQSQKAFEGWVQHMSQPHDQAPAPAQAPAPKGPMPQNANPNSRPAGY